MRVQLAALVSLGLGSCALAAGLWTEGRLVFSGKEVTTDYLVKNGRTYVPIADVAKAMNLSVKKIDGGFELAPGGVSGQVEGLNGKIGDQLNCGDFLFKVVDALETQSYDYVHSTYHVTPIHDGEKLVVVKFHLQNASAVVQSLDLWGGDLTALTSGDNNFKTKELDGTRAPDMLPGSSIDFALIYYLPKDLVLKDMVYQLHAYNGTTYKDHTFRVSLKKG